MEQWETFNDAIRGYTTEELRSIYELKPFDIQNHLKGRELFDKLMRVLFVNSKSLTETSWKCYEKCLEIEKSHDRLKDTKYLEEFLETLPSYAWEVNIIYSIGKNYEKLNDLLRRIKNECIYEVDNAHLVQEIFKRQISHEIENREKLQSLTIIQESNNNIENKIEEEKLQSLKFIQESKEYESKTKKLQALKKESNNILIVEEEDNNKNTCFGIKFPKFMFRRKYLKLDTIKEHDE